MNIIFGLLSLNEFLATQIYVTQPKSIFDRESLNVVFVCKSVTAGVNCVL